MWRSRTSSSEGNPNPAAHENLTRNPKKTQTLGFTQTGTALGYPNRSRVTLNGSACGTAVSYNPSFESEREGVPKLSTPPLLQLNARESGPTLRVRSKGKLR